MNFDKTAILNAIKLAETTQVAQQDVHNDVLSGISKIEATAQQLRALRDIGWAGVISHMSTERYPPSCNDWSEILGVRWNETPKYKLLSRIGDDDIRSAIYFFSEIEEHTQRIRAAASFYTYVGGTTRAVNCIFRLWVLRQKIIGLADTSDPNDSNGRELLKALAVAADYLGDTIVHNLDNTRHDSAHSYCQH